MDKKQSFWDFPKEVAFINYFLSCHFSLGQFLLNCPLILMISLYTMERERVSSFSPKDFGLKDFRM